MFKLPVCSLHQNTDDYGEKFSNILLLTRSPAAKSPLLLIPGVPLLREVGPDGEPDDGLLVARQVLLHLSSLLCPRHPETGLLPRLPVSLPDHQELRGLLLPRPAGRRGRNSVQGEVTCHLNPPTDLHLAVLPLLPVPGHRGRPPRYQGRHRPPAGRQGSSRESSGGQAGGPGHREDGHGEPVEAGEGRDEDDKV